MNKILSSRKQEVSSYITIHEFWEKSVPCWDTVRYDLPSPKGLANKLRPFLSNYLGNEENRKKGYVYSPQGSKYSPKVLESAYEEYKEAFVPYSSFRKGFKGITSGAPKNKPIKYFNDTWPDLNRKFHSYDRCKNPLPEITKLDFKIQELLKDYICCKFPKITVYNDSWFYGALSSQSISEGFTVQWFDLNFHETYQESNIIWSTTNFVSLWGIYRLYVESPINNSLYHNPMANNDFISKLRIYENLLYYRPSLTENGMLTFNLYVSQVLAKTLCRSFGIEFSLKCDGECGNCNCCNNSNITKINEAKTERRKIAEPDNIKNQSENVKVFRLFGFELETKLRKKKKLHKFKVLI